MSIDTYPAQATQNPNTPVLLGYAEKTANQTLTAIATLTDLSVSVVVPEGRRIRIKVHQVVNNSSGAAAWTVLLIKEDGVGIKDGVVNHAASGNATYGTHETSIIKTPTAGLHTYTVELNSSNFNVVAESGGTRKSYISVEDVTGMPVPAGSMSVPVGQLAYAQIIADSTAIGSTDTTVGGLSVNIVVPAGRTIRISHNGLYKHSNADVIGNVWIKEGTTGLVLRQIDASLANLNIGVHAEVVLSPSAGSHTYQVMVSTATGTIQPLAGATYPAFLLVEDITPTPAPANTAPSSTLAYAEITTTPATFTSIVDIPGLSVAVTVAAGRRIRVSAQGVLNNSAAGNRTNLFLYEAGAQLQRGAIVAGAAGINESVSPSTVLSPSAGSHTYYVRASADAGTGTLTATTTGPAYILVEDITGAVLPIPASTGFWTPGPTFPASPTAGDLFYETDTDKLWAYNGTSWVEMGRTGVWTDFTPVFVQGATPGMTSFFSRWTRFGRTIHWQCKASFNGSPTGTANNVVLVTLPFVTVSADFRVIGIADFYDGSQAKKAVCEAEMYGSNGTLSFNPCAQYTDQRLGVTGDGLGGPAIASGDQLTLAVTYEAAAST
jgi:hypothetical protein